MGRVLVREYTTKTPLQMIGESAGFCWGSDISDANKNVVWSTNKLAEGLPLEVQKIMGLILQLVILKMMFIQKQ